MKRARYRGDVTDQFHVGQILGRLDSGGFIRCTGVDYDDTTDQTIVTAEHGQPAAPDGMRLRFHGENEVSD